MHFSMRANHSVPNRPVGTSDWHGAAYLKMINVPTQDVRLDYTQGLSPNALIQRKSI